MNEYLFDDIMRENKLSFKNQLKTNKSIRASEKVINRNWKFAKKIIYPAIENVEPSDTKTLSFIVTSIQERDLFDFKCFSYEHMSILRNKMIENKEFQKHELVDFLTTVCTSHEITL